MSYNQIVVTKIVIINYYYRKTIIILEVDFTNSVAAFVQYSSTYKTYMYNMIKKTGYLII